jgi:putative transposase
MMPVKTVAGRKRHLVVDCVGNLLAIAVDTAAMSDAAGARWVLGRTRARWPHLVKGWADQTYRGTLVDWARQTYDIDLEIVQRPAEAEGFVLLPRRWVVERTIAWLGRSRRLSKEYEHHPDHTESISYLASCQRLLQRLCPAPSRAVPYLRRTG